MIPKSGAGVDCFIFPRPTIAMVNGFCFGGGFTPLIACDFAIAAEDATFGLSELNWGIFPGGLVSRVLTDAMCYRDAMWYIMTGDPFRRQKSGGDEVDQLHGTQGKIARRDGQAGAEADEKESTGAPRGKGSLQILPQHGLCPGPGIYGRHTALRLTDPETGHETGMEQFVDKKTYRPGMGEYDRNAR
jgi:trans-feruloyl-CoA hydratase/vanillin synthase